jgi:phosphopantothenoylcysteine decarboxylase/phosphopantothenate--cysteine ligase
MVEPQEIYAHIVLTLAKNGPLAGRTLVVTAGGTQEPIDPVRVIMNRSSGKQGLAIAQAALEQGARVVLVSGPVHQPIPVGVEHVAVQTAEEMHAAVLEEAAEADALVMAAAVADFRPVAPTGEKIKRARGVPQIVLETTPDILAEVADLKQRTGKPAVLVGFAAESQDLIENARQKLRSRRLDLIVANDITARDAGFAADTNRVTILDAGGGVEDLPLMSKADVAAVLIERIIGLLP